MKLLEFLDAFLWPLVSVMCGLVGGTIFGFFATLFVFAITLVRTPMHIVKMMYVTATTDECFKRCQYFDPFLRLAVFLLVPVPHIIWLVGITAFCSTIGTMYYIGKGTKATFERDYNESLSKIWSNIKLEKKSIAGDYIQNCQEYMANDDASLPTIHFLKGCCAMVPGLIIGSAPFIPFSISILLISLYRYPINILKTMKIALYTVVLQWDLKLCAIAMLPFAHSLFVLVVFVTALIGSWFSFVFWTTESIASGKSPFDQWGMFKKGLEEYYKAHQQFVGERYLGRYDHPTGIPSGWQGESYGLPIWKILKWQWDFLVCCLLVVLGFPICLAGSCFIFTLKLVPGIFSWWRMQCRNVMDAETTHVLGCWVFYLLGFLLTPAGAVLLSVLAIIPGTLMCFRIPHVYLVYGHRRGLYAPFEVLHDVDMWDFYDLNELRAFPCLVDVELEGMNNLPHGDTRHGRTAKIAERKRDTEAYWDRFASQCIHTTSSLLERHWIVEADVRCMEPSVLQTVPAVAALTILVDTLQDSRATNREDITWKIDATICKGHDRSYSQMDAVAALLWPKVMTIKRLLNSKKDLTNVTLIAALLCMNTDETTNELNDFVKFHSVNRSNDALDKTIRSELVGLSLMLLQVKPFQDRMKIIFEHEYSERVCVDEEQP